MGMVDIQRLLGGGSGAEMTIATLVEVPYLGTKKDAYENTWARYDIHAVVPNIASYKFLVFSILENSSVYSGTTYYGASMYVQPYIVTNDFHLETAGSNGAAEVASPMGTSPYGSSAYIVSNPSQLKYDYTPREIIVAAPNVGTPKVFALIKK